MTYQDHTNQITQLIGRQNGTWDGIDAEAVARMRALGKPVRLTLVGDGENRAAVEAAITRLGIRDDVTITGWADEARVRAELTAARAMVMPSFAEGLPIVVMEALALGRPVLASNVAAMSELVISGQTGWLFAPGSVDAIVAAMTDCLDTTTGALATIGRAGRDLVRERHDAAREAGDDRRAALRQIVLHLGNGASASAVRGGDAMARRLAQAAANTVAPRARKPSSRGAWIARTSPGDASATSAQASIRRTGRSAMPAVSRTRRRRG